MDAANAIFGVILDKAGEFRALVSRSQVCQAIFKAPLHAATARTIGLVFYDEPRPIVVEADTPLRQIALEHAEELHQFPHLGIILTSHGVLTRIVPRDTILDLLVQYGVRRSADHQTGDSVVRTTIETSGPWTHAVGGNTSGEASKESASQSSVRPPDALERYTNVRIFESENFVRGSEIRDKPLVAGRQCILDVSIGLNKTGVPVEGPVEAIRRLGAEMADLFVVVAPADESEWEVYDPIQPLRLPPAGPTAESAIFVLTPNAGSIAKRRLLFVKVYYRLNLIDSLVLAAFVTPTERQEDKPDDGRPLHFLAFDGFPERYAEIDRTLTPKKLNLALKRTGANEWRLSAVLDVADSRIPLIGYANLSDARMQEIVDDARRAWDIVITDNRLYDIKERPAAFADALAALAETGSKAWSSLMSAGGVGQALNSIGQILGDNPPVAGAPVQIICEERGVDFIFPWTLVYMAPYRKGQEPDIENFWGFRYDMEMRSPQVLSKRSITAPCQIGYAFWRSNAAMRQRDMLDTLARERTDEIVVVEPSIETGNEFVASLKTDGLDVLYVFAHGYTRTVGLGGLAALSAWLGAKLGRNTGALPDELAALKDNLDEVARTNQDDWIRLTKSTLTITELQMFRGRLYRKPIVFLNMCHSAQINPGLSGGFVGYFLQRGACAVIGTECPIPPFFAEVFALEMFRGLAEGKTLGQSVYTARRIFKDQANPLALAYSVYGCADSQIIPSSQQPSL
jgi:hypothetical protein